MRSFNVVLVWAFLGKFRVLFITITYTVTFTLFIFAVTLTVAVIAYTFLLFTTIFVQARA